MYKACGKESAVIMLQSVHDGIGQCAIFPLTAGNLLTINNNQMLMIWLMSTHLASFTAGEFVMSSLAAIGT